ncbi:hypothetical protein HC256_004865 [Beauveria bassiana]|nr:hypothetical protein HC256_004865 [Beauveria bassiana]
MPTARAYGFSASKTPNPADFTAVIHALEAARRPVSPRTRRFIDEINHRLTMVTERSISHVATGLSNLHGHGLCIARGESCTVMPLQLTDILVFQLMGQTNFLRLVLDRFAVDNGRLEDLGDTSVNGITLHESP